MSASGKCLCGKVSYELDEAPTEIGACHCSMCRKWSGGINVSVEAKPEAIQIHGEENVTYYKSSEFAERGFCTTCGSSMFMRITVPGPINGTRFVGAGTLNNTEGLKLVSEIYVDNKPDAYNFAEPTQKMTEAEFLKMIGVDAS